MTKTIYEIFDEASYKEFKDHLVLDKPRIVARNGNVVETEEAIFEVDESFTDWKKLFEEEESYDNDLIYGKDKTEGIVAVEVKDDQIWLFKNTGEVEKRPAKYWLLANTALDQKFRRLKGNSHYKYVRTFTKAKDYYKWRNIYSKRDTYCIWNDVESQMVSKGITLFKGLKVEDVSVLSTDLEGMGLVRDDKSQAFVITNTFRKNGEKLIKQFRQDNYLHQWQMIEAWCEWVREIDPDIITGHNLFGYDFDYLRHIMSLQDKELILGRDGSAAKFNLTKPKKYRVDGSQTWEYNNCEIFGRHIVDGMFLAVKYDIGRNYPSWKLKDIAEYEGIVAEDRQFYDASLIGKNWYIPEEREKIVKYCEHDGNDSLGLYDIMIPSFFYMAQSIPKPFQVIINSASGSWLNLIMVRSYLQNFQSIPKANRMEDFGKVSGGISFGIPGVHDNVFKIDIKSMYPSIMLEYKVNDPKKDPDNNFYNMVEHFTHKRFAQKAKHKETGNKYYDDLQASSKIFINSCYGMLGTNGLNFNNFAGADFITGMGRQIIRETMKWATGADIDKWWDDYTFDKDERYSGKLEASRYLSHDFVMVNADTDSISFRKADGASFSTEEMNNLIEEINSVLPEKIEYEDDGYFDRIIVVKAKNYVLKTGDKIKYKGSSLTDSKKEKALLELLHKVIEDSLIYETRDYTEIYDEYIKEAVNVKDISRWTVKKSVTEKLLESDRANETKVVDALKGTDFQIGDKVFVFNDIDGEVQAMVKGEPVFFKKTGEPKMVPNKVLKLQENFTGSYDKLHYVDRVYKTFKILENVIDMDRLLRYNLKKNQALLKEL